MGLWQFTLASKGRGGVCDMLGDTLTKEYALTSSLSEKPCCFPGYCLDSAVGQCNHCAEGRMIRAADGSLMHSGCQEGPPQCRAGQVVQVDGLSHFVEVKEDGPIDDNIRVPCPADYAGEVVLGCRPDLSFEIVANNCQHQCLCSAGTAAAGTLCPYSGAVLCVTCHRGFMKDPNTGDCVAPTPPPPTIPPTTPPSASPMLPNQCVF